MKRSKKFDPADSASLLWWETSLYSLIALRQGQPATLGASPTPTQTGPYHRLESTRGLAPRTACTRSKRPPSLIAGSCAQPAERSH